MKSRFTSFVILALLSACQSAPPADPQAFRDLGIKNSFTPMEGVYCSGQPTEEQFAKLKEAGVVRVVSLRPPIEDGTGWEEAKARELGLDFVRIPVDGAAGVTTENATAMARQLADAGGPVLVMCGSSNRVGALFALKARFLDGKSAADAIAVGKACGMTRLEPTVTELVSR